MKKINGTLEAFFETGSEGINWMVYDEENKSYESIHPIKEGDFLKVYDFKDKLIFEGEIEYDLETNLFKPGECGNSYPFPRQIVEYQYVHWLQKNYNPEEWANMFFNKYPAELTKK